MAYINLCQMRRPMDTVVQIRAFVAREVAIDSLCLLYSNERAKLRDKFIYALISINYVGFLEFLAVYGDKKIRTAAVQQRINPRKKCTFMGGGTESGTPVSRHLS